MGTSFSVIVTSYNYRDYVAEAVDSALAQSRPALEVIVVDDGSTDGSVELLRERYGDDPRVNLLPCENGGQLAAFQRGLAQARGEVVCFLDSDDRWKPDYLAQLGALYDSRADVDFVFSDLRCFGTDEKPLRYEGRTAAVDLGYTAISTYFQGTFHGAPSSALSLRRALALRVLDLPERFRARWKLCADACVVHGASLHGARKYYLPTGSVDYRTHAGNGHWTTRRNAVIVYRGRMDNHGLIRHYARQLGLDDGIAEHAKHEFRTRPQRTGRDAWRYAQLALRSGAPWWKRYELALSILLDRKRDKVVT